MEVVDPIYQESSQGRRSLHAMLKCNNKIQALYFVFRVHGFAYIHTLSSTGFNITAQSHMAKIQSIKGQGIFPVMTSNAWEWSLYNDD